MKIGLNFNGFNISAKGMTVQRKKMDLVAENIANMDTTRTESGKPYQKKFLVVNADNRPGNKYCCRPHCRNSHIPIR